MRNHTFISMLAAAVTAAAVAVVAAAALCGCGGRGSGSGGGLTTLDIEAAIDNPRTFDVAEIADDIEFIPLDDSRNEGLVGEITAICESSGRFYVQDNGREFQFRVFDRQGGFLSTLGRYGRGPDEFMGRALFAADHDRDILYVAGQMGDMSRAVTVYDASGSRTVRHDSISGERIAFFDDRLFVMKGSPAPFSLGNDPDFVSSIGTSVPLLELWSPGLERRQVVETVDKGAGSIIIMKTEGGQISGISVMRGAASVLSDNGTALLVKEPLCDTIYHFRGGVLEPAYRFDFGKYHAPPDAFGLSPVKEMGEGCMVRNVMEGDRYLFVDAGMGLSGARVSLVLDRERPAGGFSALGPDGGSGLFLDGIDFRPMYVRDNRLVGYISALEVADNAGRLTNTRLKALADNLKEDSNPVIVVAKLK